MTVNKHIIRNGRRVTLDETGHAIGEMVRPGAVVIDVSEPEPFFARLSGVDGFEAFGATPTEALSRLLTKFGRNGNGDAQHPDDVVEQLRRTMEQLRTE